MILMGNFAIIINIKIKVLDLDFFFNFLVPGYIYIKARKATLYVICIKYILS